MDVRVRLARKGQHVAKPEDLLKHPYVLEFLGLEEKAVAEWIGEQDV